MSTQLPAPVLLDGGLATSLQPLGLPTATPVDAWLHSHPEAVTQVQRQFVRSGSQIVLAGTFSTQPPQPDWERSLRAAVAIAQQAAGSDAQVFASFAPTSAPGTPPRLEHTLAAAAAAIAAGVGGVVLETFVSAPAAILTTQALRAAHPELFIVASLCPQEDGRLFSGEPTPPALLQLSHAGASAVGVNCGFGPHSAVAALQDCDPGLPLWCKPNSGDLSPADFVAALEPLLSKLDFVGGCCGVTAAHIRALRDRISPP